VWILANCLVDLVRIVKSITMLLFVDVQEGSLEIHSRVAVNLPRMKSVRLVEPTLTVKWDLMIGLFADVRKITLETLSKDVEENVIVVETVLLNKSVFNSNVWLLVVKEPVEKMPIVKPETTELNVHALQISWEIPTLDVTPNVLDMMNAKIIKHV